MTSRRGVIDAHGFPPNGFSETPKRKRHDLTPLSAISPIFGASSPVAGPSKNRNPPENTPVKRMKLQQTSMNLALGNSNKPSITKPLTSNMGSLPSPSRLPQPNFSLGRLPIALKSEVSNSQRNPRLPLGAVAPVTAVLQNYEDVSGTDPNGWTEKMENDSDDEQIWKPCHPKMTDMPSLSLRLSQSLAKQKSSLALFRSSTSNQRTPTLTAAKAWSERNGSARHQFQLVSVASSYGHAPLFKARVTGFLPGQGQDATVLVAFLSESQARDEGIHPNIIASALNQGESRPITAMVWDPVQRLTLHNDGCHVWLCSRYFLSVEERDGTRAIPDV